VVHAGRVEKHTHNLPLIVNASGQGLHRPRKIEEGEDPVTQQEPVLQRIAVRYTPTTSPNELMPRT